MNVKQLENFYMCDVISDNNLISLYIFFAKNKQTQCANLFVNNWKNSQITWNCLMRWRSCTCSWRTRYLYCRCIYCVGHIHFLLLRYLLQITFLKKLFYIIIKFKFTNVIWCGGSSSTLSCELPLCNSESLLCCLTFCGVLLPSDEKVAGSDLITVPRTFVTDVVNKTSPAGSSSDTRSVEPEPEPVEDLRKRFL